MKQWFKKQKYKIAIALCSFLSIFALFLGINKTYAYETDTFSYTISSVSVGGNTYNSSFTYDSSSTYQIVVVCTPTDTIVYPNTYVLLVNYWVGYTDDTNIVDNTAITNAVSFGGNSYNFTTYYNQRTLINNHYCIVYNPPRNTDTTYDSFNLVLRFNSTNNWRLKIFNIDFVKNTDIGLSQYYDTYYGQIEDNYNQLLDNYNTLQDDYNSLDENYGELQDNYDSLSQEYHDLEANYDELDEDYGTLNDNYTQLNDDYNTLENNYNTLSNNYNSLVDSASSLWNNIYYFGLADDDYTLYTDLNSYLLNGFTLRSYDDLVNLNVIDGSYIYFDKLYSVLVADSYNFLVPFKDGVNNSTYGNHYWNYNVSSINFKSIVDTNLTFTNDEGIYLTLGNFNSGANNRIWLVHITSVDLISNNYIIDKDLILKLYPDFDFDFYNSILSISVIFDKEDTNTDKFSLYSIANDYSIGYSVGYNEGYTNGTNFTNFSLNERISNLESYNQDLLSQITSMQLTINALNEQVNSFHSDYGINNMLWTIASTPFESFREIWNVELFGVNISRVISGFITSIIVLFIVKKFF